MKAIALSAVALFAIVQLAGGNEVFKWKTIEFTDLIRPANSMVDGSAYYDKETVILTGFDYDVETGYVCGAFPRFKSVPVTIGCFSVDDRSTTTPKFTPFPTAADNDLPGWPKAMTSAREPPANTGQARGHNSYRHRPGRGRFGAYYYEEDDDEIVSDEERGHDELRATGGDDKTKAFTGFSSLGNLFKKKDKKEVVVAVVEHSGGYGGHQGSGHQWSSEENRWRPYRKDKVEHDHYSSSGGDSAYVVQNADDKDKKNAFFSFFDKFGSRISSVFNKNNGVTEKTPAFTINTLSRGSSEKEVHYRPSKYRPHSSSHHGSPSNWYSSEEDEDDRWHMRPIKRRKPSRYEYQASESEEWYRQSEKGSVTQNQERNFQSDLQSEAAGVNPSKEAEKEMNLPPTKPALQAQLTAAVSPASSASVSSEEQPRPTVVKPIRIQRPFNFISVHDTRFDKCGRLWFIDTGITEDSRNPIVYKTPTLWAFDVANGKEGQLISRPYLKYELEDSSASGLRSLVVDIHEDCDDYHVYMPNHKDNRVVVYSARRGQHWQFTHPTLEPVNKEADFSLNGESYQFTAGVYSLTMGPRDVEGFRDVYYSPASGTGQYKVNTNLLRDRQAAPNRFNPKFFKSIGYRGGDGWTRAQVFDVRSEVVFFTSGKTIQCWNTNKILTPDTYGMAYTHENMVYGADIKVDQKGNVWALSNKYPLIRSNGGMSQTEFNFNIFRIKPREVIKGTICAAPARQRRNRALDIETKPTMTDVDKRFDVVIEEEVEEVQKTSSAIQTEEVPVIVPKASEVVTVETRGSEEPAAIVPEVASEQIKDVLQADSVIATLNIKGLAHGVVQNNVS